MNIPIYTCLIDENEEDQSGIYAMSFVEQPANEVDFIALSRQSKNEFLNRDIQKQILTGVVLRPGQLIYRNDPKQGEYYIQFSAEQIEKIARKMMRTGIGLYTTTHQHEETLHGNYLVELWIVENPEQDKSKALGFSGLPKGTLMCSYKIEDPAYWQNQVMTGNVKGFSLEGFFFQEKISNQTLNIKYKTMNKKYRKSSTLLSRIAKLFLDIQAVEKADVTASGTAYVMFTLADGKEVYVDADGFVTFKDEQFQAGEHLLVDGSILVVDEEGQFVETKEASKKMTDPKQATAPQNLSEEISSDSTETSDSVESLKAKIADLESRLAELAGLAKDANAEVQKLRRHTPSGMPMSLYATDSKKINMKRYEQMAQALSMTIKNRCSK